MIHLRLYLDTCIRSHFGSSPALGKVGSLLFGRLRVIHFFPGGSRASCSKIKERVLSADHALLPYFGRFLPRELQARRV